MKKFNMRTILIIFIFILNIQNWTKADDNIKEFEIGGISLGQSLLDYANKDKIKFIKDHQQYPNDKFIRYEISKILTIENFDFVDVLTKKNDSNYIIEGISAAIYYTKLDKCLKLKKDIQENVENVLDFNEKQDTKFPSKQDATGNSIIYGVQYYTKPYPSNEGIMVNCYHMTEESNIKRVLRISVNSDEYAYFIINDAYN